MLPLPAILNGCFTGVESTPPVTSGDVQQALSRAERTAPKPLVASHDSVASWTPRDKQFIVTDNQARLLFNRPTTFDIDTVALEGRTLTYIGYTTGDALMGNNAVTLRFTDGRHEYNYPTGKTLDALGPGYRVPLLIDLDMVKAVDTMLRGKRLWVMTPIWYDTTNGQMTRGRQYIPVTVTAVKPGNKVLPLRVLFTVEDNGAKAMLWMSDGTMIMPGRDLRSLFSENDPRQSHREINDAIWTLITRGELAEGMTKGECRLSRGAPARVVTVPDRGGLHERWLYEGGSYLYFVDGRLVEFRL